MVSNPHCLNRRKSFVLSLVKGEVKRNVLIPNRITKAEARSTPIRVKGFSAWGRTPIDPSGGSGYSCRQPIYGPLPPQPPLWCPRLGEEGCGGGRGPYSTLVNVSMSSFVRIWLLISVLASLAGWALSAIGQLNRSGYILFCLVAGVSFFFCPESFRGCRRAFGLSIRTSARSWKKIRWRFRRWYQVWPSPPPHSSLGNPGRERGGHGGRGRYLPACFAVLAVLVFVGGALYPPSNHTALTYRTPRV